METIFQSKKTTTSYPKLHLRYFTGFVTCHFLFGNTDVQMYGGILLYLLEPLSSSSHVLLTAPQVLQRLDPVSGSGRVDVTDRAERSPHAASHLPQQRVEGRNPLRVNHQTPGLVIRIPIAIEIYIFHFRLRQKVGLLRAHGES